MSTNANTIFDGIHVSKRFIQGLQEHVLKLEQTQQSLIQQLEHANKLVSEYHTSAETYKQQYEAALQKISEMDRIYEDDAEHWDVTSNQLVDIYEKEKSIRVSYERDMMLIKPFLQPVLEQIFAQQFEMSHSPSPDRTHRDDIESPDHPREPMSPVSIPSTPIKSAATATTTTTTTATPTILSAHDHECIKKQLLIEADTTPFNENDERVVMRDGKRMKQWVQFGFGNTPLYGEREMTMSENEEYDEGGDQDDQSRSQSRSQEYDKGGNEYNHNDAHSSQTTDCTGDTIFHSDSD